MTQQERLLFLIEYLVRESQEYEKLVIPKGHQEQKHLLRSLMNVRPPEKISEEFLKIQDVYLTEESSKKNIVSLSSLTPVESGIYLWQGDITALKADAIVNAANSALLGCFVPCHGCIDNAIHSAAGIQLRLACYDLMKQQGQEEPIGRAKITKAYNLPCHYVLHTVGPVIYGEVTTEDCEQLRSCYNSCLELADSYNIKSIAFCCISTGEFHFPNEKAAEIAVAAVRGYQKKKPGKMGVIFNVFKNCDYEIYRRLLR